jgi:hypothetical protein
VAKVIEFRSSINRDLEALFAWINLPPQRRTYPEFERSLHARRFHRNGHMKDGSSDNVTYIHLAVAREGCKGLYIRLNRGGTTQDPAQLAFLSEKGAQGFGGVSCIGWEEARDAIVHYMAQAKIPDRSISIASFERYRKLPYPTATHSELAGIIESA